MKDFKLLLEPGYIGKIKTRNRIIKTGAGTSFIEKTGYVGETMKGFYGALAKGGVGLLTIESTGVDYPLGIHHGEVQAHLDDDKYIPSYTELAQVVHQYGCPVFVQLFHSGPWHPTRWLGLQPISASPLSKSELPFPDRDEPRGITIPEIRSIVEKFGSAAERVKKAGFDGIEINASSAHLINSFLSRAWNKREDEYGCQNLENRSRFLVEIIREIKKRLGQDFPVSVLLSVLEVGHEKGTTIKESQGFAKILESAGVDAIQARAYGYGAYNFIHPGPEQLLFPEALPNLPKELDWSGGGAGAFVPLAAAIKKVVSIPVTAVGRLNPELGENILKQGKADFIAFNRRLLADPELPNKVASGQYEKIAPCTACLHCWYRRRQNLPIQCRINPALGQEDKYSIKPAEKKKKVLVVGAGAAGMEAARVAALRGHEVMLYEKGHSLGGLLPMAGMVKGIEIEDFPGIVHYFSNQLTQLGVEIRLGQKVGIELIEKMKPDVVILAHGGRATLPEIPGINQSNVVNLTDLDNLMNTMMRFLGVGFSRWLTKLFMPVGKSVVVIGSDYHGCELAEFFTKRGRKVTIVDSVMLPGEGIHPDENRDAMLKWLGEKGVNIITEANYKEITKNGLVITNKEGKTQTLEARSIVPALTLKADLELFKKLEGKVPEVYTIGDCREPGHTVDAVADGSRIAHII
jgi:2,4-dienoyl-CoA reductase (NADPH2)